MADLFGKMADMQQRVADTQAKLAEERVTAEAGGGMVTVVADGTGRVVSIKIEPAAVDPDDLELLEDLVVAGVNKAITEAESIRNSKMQEAASSMLPPGLDLGGMDLPKF
ncbi:YbaB/EbfC family nucleoid-associated protein [Rubrivirga sp. SAORIC476]|uniref:YbaB/EbfC family nucleoid-associated protein n=1 Tax=Rubrivirga sp. SAORIC476 TaxID=1961794 RepID=UPI0018EA193E|nr:YbaB/EbfC family nucleoid-associated protein [Rubrivirga sp. SAORIC476]